MSKAYTKLLEIYHNEVWKSEVRDLYSKLYSKLHHNREFDVEILKGQLETIVSENGLFKIVTFNCENEEEFKNKFDIELESKQTKERVTINLGTYKSWYIKNPEDCFASLDHYCYFVTDKMEKIENYFMNLVNEPQKILLDMTMKNKYSISYDSYYKYYQIEKFGASDYSNSISGRFEHFEFHSKYFGRTSADMKDKISWCISSLQNVRKLSMADDIMNFAKENLDGEEQSITWVAYKI